MPRKKRVYLPGMAYHLVQRGNNRKACFFGEEDYSLYPNWVIGDGGTIFSEKGEKGDRTIYECWFLEERMRKFLLFLLLMKSVPSFADTAWYCGTINRIWPHDQNGGFIVTFSGPSSIDDCKHKYVYFLSANQSAEMLKNSFSLALSAFHSGDTVGVVMDKDLNGEYCHAMGIDIRK